LTGLLLLLALHSWGEYQSEPWDILETPGVFYWTSATAIGGRGRILFDGEPAVLLGDQGLPPWGSFHSVTQCNPLEGGLWSGSDWSLDFGLPEIPDSTYESKVGLLENTAGNNRYMGYLRRPLPLGLLFGLSVGREDTLNSQRIRLGLGSFGFTARLRQGDGDRYMLGAGWTGENGLSARTNFARMYGGGRQVELMGSLETGIATLSLEAGAGGAWLRDSVFHSELHVLSRFRPGAFTFTGRVDVRGSDDRFDFGGAGGCAVQLGPVGLQAGIYLPPGDDVHLLAQADAGPVTARAVFADEGAVAAGADLDLSIPHLLARGSATAWESDSVSLSGIILPSIRYWNALISAGARCDLDWAEGDGWQGTVDLVSTFTLGRFALIVAVESVDDDIARNWTYGITWEFTDRPPSIDTEEEENGRG
jgi:hypothetical protein